MAKYTPEQIEEIADVLKVARTRAEESGDHAAHFLIGAGCSITAGIPSAMDLVKESSRLIRLALQNFHPTFKTPTGATWRSCRFATEAS
jgi:hypothetical protein